MNGEYTPERLEQAWVIYLQRVSAIAVRKVELRENKKLLPLQSLLSDVLKELSSVPPLLEIRTAAVELDSTLLEYLTREIEYFNYQYETLGVSENCDEALEDAGTVKESLEYFLGAIPERIKGLLKILNDIFKLVSGGSGV